MSEEISGVFYVHLFTLNVKCYLWMSPYGLMFSQAMYDWCAAMGVI